MRKFYDLNKGHKSLCHFQRYCPSFKAFTITFQALPPYTEQQFLEVAVKVLPKLKIARMIGSAVWNQKGDIRDVISVGKLVRKEDGPEELEQIIDTMTKYGQSNESNFPQ
ncbi:MAG: hypothetical protein WAM14_16715 [Candidatus Nitrosopolaris sp.]